MTASTLAGFGTRSCVLRCVAFVLALMAGSMAYAKGATKANWFPSQPATPHFNWIYKRCDGCTNLQPKLAWIRMARLAGLKEVHFLRAPDETNGPAYSYAPNAVVLSPSTSRIKPCQLAFIVGHELTHIAQRHFDEDAMALSALTGKRLEWTREGARAMRLLDGDFPLALRMSPTWQQQEREADWVGALLAADACGCTLEESALSYLRGDEGDGGGVAAAHGATLERLQSLKAFSESAKRLAARAN